jgi:ADP-ribose pyrophosphatase YjhB (NUDIX family)
MELVKERQRPRCTACRQVAFLDPKLVAAALVPKGGELLLIRRNNEPGRGLWALPGGYVERGEPVEAAVAREVQEETGLTVQVQGLVGLYSEAKNPLVLAAYAAEAAGGVLLQEPTREVQEVAFFPRDAFPSMAFPRDPRIIADWLRWRERR